MAIEFAKLHGCGNDYIAIDGRSIERDWGPLTAEISKPAFGVGSDGIVLLLDSDVAQVRMRVYNPDGSEAEMSGNGIRLFAKFVLDRGIAEPTKDGLTVETLGGVRTVWPEMVDGRMKSARVAMGPAMFTASEVPVDTTELGGIGEVIAEKTTIGGVELSITCLAIGNPHAVAITDQSVEDFPLLEVGPLVENHLMFPQRINFEVVNVHARG
ncbi:MAG: diaminopimelate epimerase, partial [Chloroflexi bacterium]|nr:diaminopimelate epimerase [Chloroflexota bacterium]